MWRTKNPRKPKSGMSLADLEPEIASEWDYEVNGELTPFHVTLFSNMEVGWKCNKSSFQDHIWDTEICHRTGKHRSGCPCCAGQKAVLSNCLATLRPEIASEWHPTLNGELTPFNVVLYSNRKVWWQCADYSQHIWEAIISNRTGVRKSCCPFCSDSHGEKLVAKYLKEINLPFKRQFKFDACKNIRVLRFDFAVRIKNIIAIVEFHGIQQYEIIEHFGKESFELTQLTDKIKNNFCIDKNIPLLIIPYWDIDNINIAINSFITILSSNNMIA